MTVAEIVDDIIARIPEEVFIAYNGEPGILRVLNRVYKNINQEELALEKELEITESSSGYTLPGDWIVAFACDDEDLVFVDVKEFDSAKDGFYTIRLGKLIFASADTTNTVTFYYYSTGLTLVRTVSDSNTEVASPEWQNVSLHSFLYYAALVELGVANAYEIDQWKKRKYALNQSNWNKDHISPTRTMPHTQAPSNRYIDDYEKP